MYLFVSVKYVNDINTTYLTVHSIWGSSNNDDQLSDLDNLGRHHQKWPFSMQRKGHNMYKTNAEIKEFIKILLRYIMPSPVRRHWLSTMIPSMHIMNRIATLYKRNISE